MTVDLHPEPTIAAMPVAARTIPEFAPSRGEVPSGRSISQAMSDARARLVELRIVELEGELSALRQAAARNRAARRRKVDARKVYIAAFKAKYPGVKGVAICLCLDKAAETQPELKPRTEWITATGLRSWMELWNDRSHPRIRGAVKKYIHSVLAFESRRN
jgi:hypothetical protein